MEEIRIQKIKRISGIYCLPKNNYTISKTLCTGIIKTIEIDDKTTFSGLVIDTSGNDYQVMKTIMENIADAYYVKGIIQDKKLNFTVFANKCKTLADYRLTYGGLNEYYGSSFNIYLDTNCRYLSSVVSSYKSSFNDYARVSINELDEKTNVDDIEKKLGEAMYIDYRNRDLVNSYLRGLLVKEKTATITEAFEKRSAGIVKKLLKDKNN